jgi:hypothetical protein
VHALRTRTAAQLLAVQVGVSAVGLVWLAQRWPAVAPAAAAADWAGALLLAVGTAVAAAAFAPVVALRRLRARAGRDPRLVSPALRAEAFTRLVRPAPFVAAALTALAALIQGAAAIAATGARVEVILVLAAASAAAATLSVRASAAWLGAAVVDPARAQLGTAIAGVTGMAALLANPMLPDVTALRDPLAQWLGPQPVPSQLVGAVLGALAMVIIFGAGTPGRAIAMAAGGARADATVIGASSAAPDWMQRVPASPWRDALAVLTYQQLVRRRRLGVAGYAPDVFVLGTAAAAATPILRDASIRADVALPALLAATIGIAGGCDALGALGRAPRAWLLAARLAGPARLLLAESLAVALLALGRAALLALALGLAAAAADRTIAAGALALATALGVMAATVAPTLGVLLPGRPDEASAFGGISIAGLCVHASASLAAAGAVTLWLAGTPTARAGTLVLGGAGAIALVVLAPALLRALPTLVLRSLR